MFKQKIENFYIDSLQGKRKDFFSKVLLLLLAPFSLAYGLFIFFRNRLYLRGWLKPYRPKGAVVVSVGNLSMGGTGKTPIAIKLAQELLKEGPLAILSRGYRSSSEKGQLYFQGSSLPASLCGDEPRLFADAVPQAHFFIGKNRTASAKSAISKGIKTLILDDGMQHRRLYRDFEITVIDGSLPLEKQRLIPRGILREGPEALQRSDLIVMNHVFSASEASRLRRQIKRFSDAPVIFCRPEFDGAVDLAGAPADLREKKAGMLCGIGNPGHFRKLLESANVEIVGELLPGDHKACSEKELFTFAENCKQLGASFIACTEKDRVKLPDAIRLPIKLICVRMRLDIIEGKKEWEALVGRIRSESLSVK